MTFKLPELPYSYDALAPYMSAETLEYHHDKHHQAYVDKGNELIKGTGREGASLEKAMVWAYENKPGLFNQLGQHWNHIHFWNWMAPKGGGRKIPGALEKMINENFESFDAFRRKFIETGTGVFGSGWVWLGICDEGKLAVVGLPNGENPLVHGATPLLGCDVWEHSYYIDYRNARPKYLEAFIDNLVNWEYVAELLEKGPVKIAA